MDHLPTGTVTFLFTDIEGSTRLLAELGEGYRAVQDDHFRLMRAAIATGGGVELRTEGDAFFVVFPSAVGAVRAAAAAQRAFAGHDWPHGRPLRVRMGLHSGEGMLGGDDYLGIDVNRAARVAAAGHGGQVVLSQATRALAEHDLPGGVSLRDLGEHRLKDLPRPERLHQLVIEGLPSEFPALKTLEARPNNLPAQLTSFVGREREISEVREVVGSARLVTLTGPGGTGKTRLALEVAGRLLLRFADGAFFVDLSAVTDPALVPSQIAGALGVAEDPGRPIAESVQEHLRDREVLLVLDNFEQVLDAAPAVGDLLAAAPRAQALVTSRSVLHLPGEREVPVPPLLLPDPGRLPDLEALSQYEAVALFIERARASRPGFAVTNENAPAVAEICARLDGLPLAIELAASRAKLLSPQEILARLEHRLPLLATATRGLPERQRTLRGAIAWSHELLDEAERRLFARLSTFAGGATLASIEAVTNPEGDHDTLETLGSLVDKSLVRVAETAEGETRYGMLETIREFAAERLVEDWDAAATRRRHAEHVRDLATEAEPHFTGEEQARWLARFQREQDNVRAALGWAIDSGDADTGLRTGAALWRFWQQRGRLAEGREWMERLLALPSERGPVRAWALTALGSIAYWQNDYGPMQRAYDEALAIARELGDPLLLAHAYHNAAYRHMVEQDHGAADEVLREGLRWAEAAGDAALEAEISIALGWNQFMKGDPGSALGPLRRGLDTLLRAGKRFLVADTLTGMAGMEVMIGDLESAAQHYRQALDLFREAGNPLGAAMVVMGGGVIEAKRGRHERAARLWGAEARMRDEHGGGVPAEFREQLWGSTEQETRAALGDERFERAFAEGNAMGMDKAIAYMLEDAE
ncbi:MAG TPA: adenylate/guanylate cyclase domain-containing protein [Actinomycetota bacterium]|nr:adenylate/guanylate cyclase domain-containing protein [Actinomycetota bacterium]